jgi:hypothetical protein
MGFQLADSTLTVATATGSRLQAFGLPASHGARTGRSVMFSWAA